jgi:DNA ligase (NAD+)
VETRSGSEIVFSPPEKCPVCSQATQKLPDEVAWFCINTACPAQLIRNIEYFVSRPAMEIVGLGIKIVEQLVNEKVVLDVADLYKLTVSDLLPLEGFALKKAENLINAINSSRTKPLSRLITALGIRGVGEVMASELAQNFHDLDTFSKVTIDDLISIEGVGPNIALQIVNWFQKESNQQLLSKLKEFGVWPVQESKRNKLEGLRLSGKNFVVTGTLEKFSRTEIKEFIENYGGKVVGSVSKNTDYVLVGENPGSKADKAKELKINIINEFDLLKMVEQQ